MGTASRAAARRSARGGLAVAAAAAACAGALRALEAGGDEGIRLGLLLLAMAGGVLATAHGFAARRSAGMPVTRHLALGIGVTLGLAIAGTGVVARLSFTSTEDARTLFFLLAFLAALVFVAARQLAGPLLRDLDGVRASIEATGAGSGDARGFHGSTYAELDQVAEAGQAMLGRLTSQAAERRSAEDARTELLVAFSHDLRTPLTSLRLLSVAIADELDPAIRLRYLRQLGTHVEALSVLIDDLFELARLESGDTGWSMYGVALDDIVEETVEAFLPAARARRIVLRSEIPAELPAVEAAPEKLQRVLFNVIHNALRHTPDGGRVTVGVRPAAHGLEVEVADSGEGIAPEERERVFEAFYRRGQAGEGAGAGLGLTISRGIVQAHGGRMWIAGDPPGTRVRFSLPRAAAAFGPTPITPAAG